MVKIIPAAQAPAALAPTQSALLHQIPEACRLLGIGRSALYELAKSGAFPIRHIGRRALVADTELRAYVARLTA